MMAGLNGVKYGLSQEQLQILAEEINSDPKDRGYAGCTRGGICKLLNENPPIDNPKVQTIIKNPIYITLKELISTAGITFKELNKINQTDKGKLVLNYFAENNIDLNHPLFEEILKFLAGGIVATRYLPREKINIIHTLRKTKIEAINTTQPQSFGLSRIEKILDLIGIMVEGHDIKNIIMGAD